MFELETIEILLMAWEKIFQKIELGVTVLTPCSMSKSKLSNMTCMGVRKLKTNSYNLAKNLGSYLPAAISAKFEILWVQIQRHLLYLQQFKDTGGISGF